MLSAASATVTTSGCFELPIVPEDAEVRLLTPPVIVQDSTLTMPLPGSVVPVTAEATPFRVVVASASNKPLKVRAWLDRHRPATRFTQGEQVAFEDLGVDPTIQPVDAGTLREPFVFPYALPPSSGPGCYRLDLYISEEFRPEPLRAEEPLRPNDVAHARWYLLREGGSTTITARACVD